MAFNALCVYVLAAFHSFAVCASGNLADGFKPGGNDGGYSFGAALSTYTKKGNKWVFGGE